MMPIERKSKLRFRWWPNFGGDTGLGLLDASVTLDVDSKLWRTEVVPSSGLPEDLIKHTVSMAGQTLQKQKTKSY